MISFNENEVVIEEKEEEYDYTNEVPLKEESDYEYEENEIDYCD